MAIIVESYITPISGTQRIEVNIGGGIVHSLSIEEAIELRAKLHIVIEKLEGKRDER